MVQRLHHVLLAVTESETSTSMLPLAAAFADANGAELSLLLVANAVRDIDRIAEACGIDEDALSEQLLIESVSRHTVLLDGLASASRPEITTRVGTPFVEIIRHVVRHDVDLVIKAPDARGGLLGNVLTSTDQHLLRKCPGAVWLSDAAPRGMPRRIVVAIDVDDGSAPEPGTVAALNARLLQYARAIAAAPGAELHLVHAWHAPGAALIRRCASAADPVAASMSYVSRIRELHSAALARIEAELREACAAASVPEVDVQTHFVEGSPRQVLPELARKLGAEVLVMGTTARTRVPGLIIGNTAEDVLNSVDCGILSVKPPTFESPIA